MGPAWRVGVVVTVIGLVAGGAVAAARGARSETYQALDVYTEAMTIIHNQYVDELPWSKIVQDGIRGAIEGLDADSTVVEARKPAGSADVGLLLTHKNGGLDVIATQDDSPARGAGFAQGPRRHGRHVAVVDRCGLGGAVGPPDDAVGLDRARPPEQRVRREHPRSEDRRLEPRVGDQPLDVGVHRRHRIRLLEEGVRGLVR